MRYRAYALLLAVLVSGSVPSYAQRYNPGYKQPDGPVATPIPLAPWVTTSDAPQRPTMTILRTNSMSALDSKEEAWA